MVYFILQKIFSPDLAVLMEGVKDTRRLLSKARNPPMDEIIRYYIIYSGTSLYCGHH